MNRDYHAFRQLIRIMRLLFFLFAHSSCAWIQRMNAKSAPAQHFFSRLAPRPTARSTSVLVHAQDDDSLDMLYKTVAEQDPEWYREFVRDILGAENYELPEPTATTKAKEEFKEKDETPDFARPLTATVDNKTDEASVEVASVGKLSAQQERKNETAVLTANDETDCWPNTASATILQFSNSAQQQSSTDFEEEEVKESTLMRSRTNDEMPRVADDPPPKAETNAVDQAEEAKQSRQEPFRPQEKDTPKYMGTSADDAIVETTTIRSKETETQGVKETNESLSGTAKYQTIPIVSKKVSEFPTQRASKDNSMIKANINDTKGLKREAVMDPSERQEANSYSSRPAPPEVSQQETKAQSWFDSPPWKQATTVAASTIPKQGEETASITENSIGVPDYKRISSDEENFVVLYRDLYTGVMRAENLTAVTLLGYNITEIPYLQPDALALIVEDEIRKPTRGIPQQWQISQSQYEVLSDDIRVVPRIEAAEIIDSINKKNQSAAKKARYPAKDLTQEGSPALNERHFSRAERPLQRESRKRRPTEGIPASSARRGRPKREEEKKKRIYNAGETRNKHAGSQTKENDPPPPSSPLWVDIDTFRGLLRSEAELRVRILGDDWADVIKEESNWRLSLYKEWLWWLNKGVGNPLFPSRSDKASQRRQSAPRYRRNVEGSSRTRIRPERKKNIDTPQRPKRIRNDKKDPRNNSVSSRRRGSTQEEDQRDNLWHYECKTNGINDNSSRAFAASPRPREKRYSDSFATRPRPVVEDAADEKSEKS